MQVKQKSANKLSRTYEVKVDAKDIEAVTNQKLAEIGKTVKVPGFRPGKVPLELVKKNYGQRVMGEVLEETVNKTSQEALNQEKIRPALQPKIEITSFEEGKDLEYNMEVDIMPDVPSVDYAKLSVEKLTVEANKDELKDALDRVAEQFKDYTPVETKRAAKKGDTVEVDFIGYLGDEPFEGGSGEDVRLTLGSGTFLKDFEEGVVGAKVGDKLNVDVAFPKDYHKADLAGQKTKFDITVKQLLEETKSEITDEFAKKLGLKDAADLKEKIKEQLESEYVQAARTLMKRELFDKLEAAYNFDVPERMVEMELESIARQLDHSEHKHEEGESCGVTDNFRPMAERRVRLGILLAELGHRETIKVEQNDLNNAIMEQARQFPGQEQQVLEYFQKNPNAVQELSGPILEEKVVDFLFGKIKTKETKSTADALKARLDALDDEADEMQKAKGGAKKSGKKTTGAKAKSTESKSKADTKAKKGDKK
jgi:trigger factor